MNQSQSIVLTVGVLYRLLVAKIEGTWPISAIPISCKLSADISPKNKATIEKPAPTTIQLPSHLPPISVAAVAKAPAVHSDCDKFDAPVAISTGTRYDEQVKKNAPAIPLLNTPFETEFE